MRLPSPAARRDGRARVGGCGIARPPSVRAAGPDGRYRQGVLRGKSVPDESARYIGATARQENRARQIAALDAQLADKEAEMREVEQERQAAQEALARLDEEYRQRPTTADVAAALQIADAQRAMGWKRSGKHMG